MSKELIFILGGARSGKSDFAERIASKGKKVLFVATAQAYDDEMKQRIAKHQSNRPESWTTLEEPIELTQSMRPMLNDHDTILLDCLTLWVSNILLKNEGQSDVEAQALKYAQELIELYRSSSQMWILVSNEVGLGVVPPTPLGRIYRDILGKVNQLVATQADKVYLMSAGLALELKSLGARPFNLTDI